MKWIAIFILLHMAYPLCSRANGLCDNNPEFTVEDSDMTAKVREMTWKLDDLPRGIVELLHRNEFDVGYKEPPTEATGFLFDLNGDGADEYFIKIEAWSGSGGWAYLMLSQFKGQWTVIGNFQRGFIPLTTKKKVDQDNWRDFVNGYRGGGDIYIHTKYSFDGKTYKSVSGVMCDKGKITRSEEKK